jgi:hypothetical protein
MLELAALLQATDLPPEVTVSIEPCPQKHNANWMYVLAN